MNPTGKKFLSVFLVFSLMMLSVNLYAREKRGAMLLITKMDGTQFQGELIAVKQNSLLILVPGGKDVSFDIEEIKRIEVKRISKFWTMVVIGGGIGTLIGGGIGVARGLAEDDELLTPAAAAVLGGMIYASIGGTAGALLGALIGVIAGAPAGKYKKIQIDGMTDLEVSDALDYLRKKARIRDYK